MKKIYFSLIFSCLSLFSVAQTFKMPCDSLRKNPMARRSMNCLVGSNDQVAVYEYNGGLRLAVTLNSAPGNDPTIIYEDIVADLTSNKRLALTCADLDGDKHDEIILAYTSTVNYVYVRAFALSGAGVSSNIQEIGQAMTSDFSTRGPVVEYAVRSENGKIELHSVQINSNSEQENFVLSYMRSNDNKVVHQICGFNGTNIQSYSTRVMDTAVDVSQSSTTVFNMEPWDVAFDDFDLDRKHELVFVQRNESALIADSTRVTVLKMNANANNSTFSFADYSTLALGPVNYGTISSINYGSLNMVKPEIATGDINGDQIPEIVVADMFGAYVNATTTVSSTGICGVQFLQVGRLLSNTNVDLGPKINPVANAGFLTGIFPGTAQNAANYNNIELNVVDYNRDRCDDIVFSGPARTVIVKGRRSGLVPRCAEAINTADWNTTLQLPDSILTINHTDFINTRKSFSTASLTDITVDGNPEYFRLESKLAPEGTQRLFLTKYAYTSYASPTSTTSYALAQSAGVDGFNCALASGDLSGDGYELGTPFTRRFNDVAQPTVVLCAPPVHYDCFGEDCTSASLGGLEATATYTRATDDIRKVESSSNSAWSVEASVGTGYEGAIASVNVGFSASYGESFESIGMNEITRSIVGDNTISGDDLLIYTTTPYQVTEYPILQGGNVVSHTISLMALAGPTEARAPATGADSPASYIPTHEPGNIFSYRNVTEPYANEDLIGSNTAIGPINTYSLSSNFSWGTSVSWSTTNENSSTRSYSASLGASLSAEAFGASLEISGSYDWGGMKTSTTTLTNTIDVSYAWGASDFNNQIPYQLAAYNTYGTNGAMILGWGTGMSNSLPTWFAQHYVGKSDPAWNMPWRLDDESELWDVDVRYKTKSIWYTPYNESNPGDNFSGDIRKIYKKTNPEPGDTIVVNARVFNMSLEESLPVPISFYHGHPNLVLAGTGNEPLADFVSGFTEIEVPPIAPQNFTDITFNLILPDNNEPYFFERGPRLYAVIDPNNFITDEVHEENNIAWSSLGENSSWGIAGTVTDENMIVSVCNDISACNYTPGANVTNTDACIYNGNSCDDGNPETTDDTISSDCICAGIVITGCMDANACNYNANATSDDGSCGAALGTPCDDQNAATENDVIVANCNCEGTAIGNSVDELNQQFSVFPNPSEGIYNIAIKNGKSIKSLEVFDVTGKKILSSKPNSSKATIDLTQYAKGFYLLNIRTSSSSHTVHLERI